MPWVRARCPDVRGRSATTCRRPARTLSPGTRRGPGAKGSSWPCPSRSPAACLRHLVPGTGQVTGRVADHQPGITGTRRRICRPDTSARGRRTSRVPMTIDARRRHSARPPGDSVHGDRQVVHARRRLERKVIQAERREDPPPPFADLDCAVRGPDPFLRVCLGSSVITESTTAGEHAPPSKVPADRTFGPAAQQHGGTRPPFA
jgi:hypothetical protein